MGEQTETVLTVRASATPQFLACHESAGAEPGEITTDADNDAARVGSAVHEVLARWVRDGEHVDAGGAGGVAHRWHVDADEVNALAAAGRRAWDELRDQFPSPMVEVAAAAELDFGLTLTGHTDVLSVLAGGRRLRVLDWKSGRKSSDHYDQLASYGVLADAAAGGLDLEEVRITTVWLRFGEYESATLAPPDLHRHRGRLLAAAERLAARRRGEGPAHYTTGEHCQHCPRFTTCPARAQMVRQTLHDLRGMMVGPGRTNDVVSLVDFAAAAQAGKLADMLGAVGCIERACELFRAMLKANVEERGPIAQPDGTRFALRTQRRREVEPRAAWPVARQFLAEDQMAPAVKLSLPKLEDAVRRSSPRGQGAANVRAMSDALRAAGALSERDETRLVVLGPRQPDLLPGPDRKGE